MVDWASASTQLAAPLNAANVKKRTQAGRSLSYIEGWHAIAEANRIFGFGAWTRETVSFTCVSEKPREIGAAKKSGFGVSYVAKVRVMIGDVAREGIGAGHGIDADLGLAHESAIKEAETDAMKRALMTFGNPFGLALYDKEQTNVSDNTESQLEDLKRLITQCSSGAELDELTATENFKATAQVLTKADYKILVALYKERQKQLTPPKEKAA